MPTSREALARHFEELVCRAVRHVAPDILRGIEAAAGRETDAAAREVLEAILEKGRNAKERGRGLALDAGLATFFVQVGSAFPGLGELDGALQDAVRAATRHEPLVPHTVSFLESTPHKDNCGRGLPVVHYEVVAGASDCHVTVLLKGAASEALSALWLLPAGASFAEIGDRLASHIGEMGSRACPPIVVGVGLGGTPERAMMLARRALLRPVGESSPDYALGAAEVEWRDLLNRTGIGPMGLGGESTVLAVHAECVDRHVAFLPVAVCVACWSDRRASVTIDRHGDVHW